MKEKSKTFDVLLILSCAGTLLVFLVWLNILHKNQNILSTENAILKHQLDYLSERLGEFELNKGNSETLLLSDVQIHFDSPTDNMPRMAENGIFLTDTSVLSEKVGYKRKEGDMEDTAVLIESTNRNDTTRLVKILKMQRKSEKDLSIYLYSPTDVSGVDYSLLNQWADRKRNRVFALKPTNQSAALNEVVNTYRKKFVISIRDHDHVGVDFADFYFLGKNILEMDESIEFVCGGSNGVWQDKSMGDFVWLSNSECQYGKMHSRRVLSDSSVSKTGISLRPEVARVGPSASSVTNDDENWNIDSFNPALMKIDIFEDRLGYDLGSAMKKPKNEWNLLEKFEKSNQIYMFPYENKEELQEYFEGTDIEKLHMYRKIVPLSLNGYKVYIVPQITYESRQI